MMIINRMGRLCTWIIFILLFQIQGCSKDIPEQIPASEQFPSKENLWVFMMAGQSNMAGRGIIESQDMVTNKRILTIDKDNKWIVAREPLHFYETGGAGLDCGLSFARELLNHVPDSVTIAMIPCAVGGSSIFEWLGDSLHRNVKLLSNFREKINISNEKGSIKCILWHQGERNANDEDIPLYKAALTELISVFRDDVGNNDLPVIMGELGRFATPVEKQQNFLRINDIMLEVSGETDNCYRISSEGLDHKGDHLHFNSEGQRELGKRYADKYIEITGL